MTTKAPCHTSKSSHLCASKNSPRHWLEAEPMTYESAPEPPRTVPHDRIAEAMELLFGPLPKPGADAQDMEPGKSGGPLIADQ
jgi:hypothetical protein